MTVRSYKDLEVWQRAIGLIESVYKVAKEFPPEERFGLTSQLQRAVVSIPANIAEGWARGSTKEYVQFLRVARGSLTETETHLIIAARLKYLWSKWSGELSREIESIGMMLNRLIQSLITR